MTTKNDKPRGYFEYLLAIDCETSGLYFAKDNDNPCLNTRTGEYYQSVSWGIIVADASTLKPIEKLYLEIQWDGKSLWSEKAESVHGLSKEYLKKNGITKQEAVVQIANLILNYWGPDNNIQLLGHNVHLFDAVFLDHLMRSEGIPLRIANRHIDTYSAGFATFGTFNSDDLFEAVGFEKRGDHNALKDAEQALETTRIIRTIFQGAIT